jgi:hypothetical protein
VLPDGSELDFDEASIAPLDDVQRAIPVGLRVVDVVDRSCMGPPPTDASADLIDLVDGFDDRPATSDVLHLR